MVQQRPVDKHLLIIEDSRSHSGTPDAIGLLWTSDQPVSETSTWQHTTLTRYKHSCPRRDSNPQSQQASGRTPTPWTVWPLGSAQVSFPIYIIDGKGEIKLLLLYRHYNTLWVLSRSTIILHESLSSTLLFQFLIFIFCRSILTSSSHLFFGLRFGEIKLTTELSRLQGKWSCDKRANVFL
jgi:hypothetical protein